MLRVHAEADGPRQQHLHDGALDVEQGKAELRSKAAATAYAADAQSLLRAATTLMVCLAWVCSSSLAILVNKAVMVDIGFKFPTTVAFLGLATTMLLSLLSVQLLAIPRSQRAVVTPRYYMTHILPTGVMMALTFQLGNGAYLYLTVAFLQMLKAFCPVITMLLLIITGLERATPRLVASVCVISVGVAIASYGEMHMSTIGLAMMLTSVFCECLRLVMTQHLLVGSVAMHPMEGLLYISSACSLCLMLSAMTFEWQQLLSQRAYLLVLEHPMHFAVAAIAGFGVNSLAIIVIKLTSSLTLKVLGTVKDAALVTIGVVFLREFVTRLQLSGYVLSLVGFVAYNVIKASAAGSRAGEVLPLAKRNLRSE